MDPKDVWVVFDNQDATILSVHATSQLAWKRKTKLLAAMPDHKEPYLLVLPLDKAEDHLRVPIMM